MRYRLLAIWLALLPASTLAAQSPNIRLPTNVSPLPQLAPQQRVQSPNPRITVAVAPQTVVVENPVVFTAAVNPPMRQPLLFRFYVDGELLPGDWQESPQYTYVARTTGQHAVYAQAGQQVGLGRRGGIGAASPIRPLNFDSSRTPFEVQSPQTPTPVPPPPNVRITVDASPWTVVVDNQVVFTAAVNPPVRQPLLFRFFVDGELLPGDWQSSPQYTYVARIAGQHTVYAQARLQLGLGRRGGIGAESAIRPLIFDSSRTPFEVQLPQTPTPVQPPANARITVDVSPPTVVVDNQVVFTAAVNPPVRQPLLFRFYVDGELLPGDWQESSDYSFVAHAVGTHRVHVEARPQSLDRGIPPANFESIPTSFDVSRRRTPPLVLTLTLMSSKVLAGEPAVFAVSVEGRTSLPSYVFDAGDRSAVETRSDGTLTHVYANAGRYVASVRLPPGVVGTIATVPVDVARSFPWWLLPVVGVLAIAAVYAVRRMGKTPDEPRHHPEADVTFHPEPDGEPRFHPAKPPGVSVALHLEQNLTSMQFAPRVRIRRGE